MRCCTFVSTYTRDAIFDTGRDIPITLANGDRNAIKRRNGERRTRAAAGRSAQGAGRARARDDAISDGYPRCRSCAGCPAATSPLRPLIESVIIWSLVVCTRPPARKDAKCLTDVAMWRAAAERYRQRRLSLCGPTNSPSESANGFFINAATCSASSSNGLATAPPSNGNTPLG